jgi:hypothetical protein
MWFPLLLFGVLSLASVPVTLTYGLRGQGLFWAVAGPVGGALTAVFYALAGRRIGFEMSGRPYLLAIGVILAGAAASGMVGGIERWPTLSVAGPPLAVCAGLLLIARHRRSVSLAWLAGLVGAVDVALLASGTGSRRTAILLGLAYGVPAILLGLAELRRQTRLRSPQQDPR